MSEDTTNSARHSAYEQAKRTYRVASNANRLYKLWNWLGWGKMGVGNTVAAIGAATAIAGGAGTILYDAVDHRARVAEAAPVRGAPDRMPAAEVKRWDGNSLVFSISGHDKAGRMASFDVLVLIKDYAWVRGSTSELTKAGKALPAGAVVPEIFSPAVREGLSRARQLIAVGIASQEGDPSAEDQRARKRAEQTAEWTFTGLQPRVPIAILNLGRYSHTCATCETTDTSWQRPFMLIAVSEEQTGVVIPEALADAMTGRSNVPSPERYALFDFERVR